MRRAMSLTVVLALLAFGAGAAQAHGRRARLQGTFAMRGTLTSVVDVYGEHPGQHVSRRWTFDPDCGALTCTRVTLKRRRSGKRILNVLVLRRRASGVYVGRGRFWVALRCTGRIVPHGGIATETIKVRVTASTMVGTTPFATAVRATYGNPARRNLTRCPGGIGHDAARYRGRRATALPGPPHAAFNSTSNLLTTTSGFTDQSQPGAGGGRIVSWSWNFGDPASADDTSTAPDPTHHFSKLGIYTVTLTVRDRYGQTATATARVLV